MHSGVPATVSAAVPPPASDQHPLIVGGAVAVLSGGWGCRSEAPAGQQARDNCCNVQAAHQAPQGRHRWRHLAAATAAGGSVAAAPVAQGAGKSPEAMSNQAAIRRLVWVLLEPYVAEVGAPLAAPQVQVAAVGFGLAAPAAAVRGVLPGGVRGTLPAEAQHVAAKHALADSAKATTGCRSCSPGTWAEHSPVKVAAAKHARLSPMAAQVQETGPAMLGGLVATPHGDDAAARGAAAAVLGATAAAPTLRATAGAPALARATRP